MQGSNAVLFRTSPQALHTRLPGIGLRKVRGLQSSSGENPTSVYCQLAGSIALTVARSLNAPAASQTAFSAH
ncbi:hypothetical protein V5799_018084 [Amblyomma americanum]|uniref:Uncharacterized protein n=1 Tax=Amblyomma americanum TaxID=6943 RepID=A0AAQ4F0W4_AMBAM